MLFTIRELEFLIPFIEELKKSKPIFEDRIEIKVFLLDYNVKIEPISSKFRELISIHQEETTAVNGDAEALNIINDKFNIIMNEEYSKLVEVKQIKPDWLKYTSLSINDEIIIEKLLESKQNV